MAAKPRAVIILAVLAVAVAAAASVSLYRYLKGQEEKVKTAMNVAVATEKVTVAAKEIPVGTTIDPAFVKTADWPKANLPAGAVTSPDKAAGRVAIQTISAEDVITEGKLMPVGGAQSIMTYKIPEGHRAMTVGVDQVSGVAGFITPGSMVDVVLTSTPPGASQPISKIVLQDIPTLATGQIIEQKEGTPVIVPTVTLDVTPEDAEKLAMASHNGTLQLLLRRSGDSAVTRTSGATVTKVFSEAPGSVTAAVAASKKSAPASSKGMAMASKKAAVKAEPEMTEVVERRPQSDTLAVEVWRDSAKTVETFRVKEVGK